MWLDRAPQYFRFKCNGLVFVGCVATKRPMLTSNSDTGHRCGSVFKQVKGGKLPDFAFLFLTFVSNKKTKWERQRHLGPFVIGLWPALLPHTPLYPSTHAWSSLTRPRPMNGQNPPVSSLLYSFFSLEWPFFSLILQGSVHTYLLCAGFADASMELTIQQRDAHTTINTEIHHCHPLVPTLRRYWGSPFEIHCYSFAKNPDPKYLILRSPPTSQYTYINKTVQLCDCWEKNFWG